MTIAKQEQRVEANTADTALLDLHNETEYILRTKDRADLQWLLSRTDPAARKLSPHVAELLQYKVANARRPKAEGTEQLVTPLQRINYVLDGEAAHKGVLTIAITARPGYIPVGSRLGATLIGMKRFQKAPLLMEDGTQRTLCVLEVEPLDPVPEAA